MYIETPRTIVAIPACNEAERIAACLQALGCQRGGALDHVLLLINNTTDTTAKHARTLRAALPYQLHIVERTYPPVQANAGHARREALALAADIVGPDGILLTTDADGAVSPDWLYQTLSAMRHFRADVVCGRALIDPAEAAAIPNALHIDDEAEVAYGLLLEKLASILDPDETNPWPRHAESSGASIAVIVETWRRAGGIPEVAVGEDRAFIMALRRIDARIRHEPLVTVTVSGRTIGRAAGGMADTMARRMIAQDTMLDETLERPEDAARRFRAHALFRSLHRSPAQDSLAVNRLVNMTGGSHPLVQASLRRAHAGQGWHELEAHASLLHRVPVPRAMVADVSETARQMIDAASGRLNQSLQTDQVGRA